MVCESVREDEDGDGLECMKWDGSEGGNISRGWQNGSGSWLQWEGSNIHRVPEKK